MLDLRVKVGRFRALAMLAEPFNHHSMCDSLGRTAQFLMPSTGPYDNKSRDDIQHVQVKYSVIEHVPVYYTSLPCSKLRDSRALCGLLELAYK